MSTVLLWDIDGTLLSTGRAGILALEDAAREVCGAELDFSELPTAGLTDHQIAVVAVEAAGVRPDRETVAGFVAVYERELPRRLPARRGQVMAAARAILEALAGRADVLSLLLTGNTAAGAAAKLSHYGLDGLVGEGAFSAGVGERSDIAHRALEIATARLGRPPALEDVYVIGDTPHDVSCGRAISARTVAVATGAYTLEALEECDPWWAVAELPPVEAFTHTVGLGRRAA